MRHKFHYSIILAAILVLSGCSEPKPLVTEISSETTSYDEVVYINNCGNKADSVQTASHSFSTELTGTGTGKLGYAVVEGSVSATYGQYKNITKSQTLTAAPETNMEFILRWSEDIRAGNVIINGESANYTVRIPVSVAQVSSQDVGCGNNDDVSLDLWKTIKDSNCDIKQENGGAIFSINTMSADRTLCYLEMPDYVNFDEAGSVEASLLAKNDASGDMSLGIIEYKTAGFSPDTDWVAQCGIIQTPKENLIELFLYIDNSFPNGQETYQSTAASNEEFYKMRLEIDPDTGAINCYANDKVIGTHSPTNIDLLKSQLFNRHFVGFWSPQSTGTFQIDSVVTQP